MKKHKPILAEEVKKDNSDLWKFSSKLNNALKLDKNKKKSHKNFVYYNTLAQIEDLVTTNPYEELDNKLDLEKFYVSLAEYPLHQDMFSQFMLGCSVKEIVRESGMSKSQTYLVMARIIQKYVEFCGEGDPCE